MILQNNSGRVLAALLDPLNRRMTGNWLKRYLVTIKNTCRKRQGGGGEGVAILKESNLPVLKLVSQ